MLGRTLRALLPALAVGAYLLPAGVRAQEVDSVVKKLQSTHTLTIGYRETSVPLSYLDENKKPTGYSVEFCQRIAEAAKKELNLPDLKINYVPVNIQTRQALVANGTVVTMFASLSWLLVVCAAKRLWPRLPEPAQWFALMALGAVTALLGFAMLNLASDEPAAPWRWALPHP